MSDYERVVTIHGLEFVLTTDTMAACGPSNGRAVFCDAELARLRMAARGGKLPREVSELLHLCKRVFGGEVVACEVLTR